MRLAVILDVILWILGVYNWASEPSVGRPECDPNVMVTDARGDPCSWKSSRGNCNF